jgi:2-iminobutanoate/2-iminopropanoate deaminase
MDFVNTAAALHGGVYSHAVVDGDRIYVSGQIATDRADGGPPLGDIEVETRVCMELLAAVLAEAGRSFADVVRVGVFMTDLREFDRMNAVYETFFARGRYPARTCVGVAEILGGCRIEIDCVARA